ncbi:MAG: membrane dipeptidase [Romboutsia sp.]|nr:membrane dipeptidase [Romboutsia sp.]
MILDIHADIFSDIFIKSLNKKENIFKNYHLNKFNDGGIKGGVFVFWKPPEVKKYYNYNGIKKMMEFAQKEINKSKDFLAIALNYDEFVKGLSENKITAMMHLEGAKGLEDNIDNIKELYDFGIRTLSLTWNEENKFATGVLGNEKNGLKPMGKSLIKQCEELGIIIDVSHTNDNTFYDIYDYSTKPIIASHSNVREICNVKRNLKSEQIKLVKETNGIVGINSYANFIHEDIEKRDLHHLVNHIDCIVDLIGIDSVCFGFDYCDYLGGSNLNTTKNLENASKSQNIIYELSKRGYKKNDIEKISYKNFLRFIRENIKK